MTDIAAIRARLDLAGHGIYDEDATVEIWDWLRELCDEVEALRNNIQNWGIIELAVRNTNVASYVEHWEGRAKAAERRIAELEHTRDGRSQTS